MFPQSWWELSRSLAHTSESHNAVWATPGFSRFTFHGGGGLQRCSSLLQLLKSSNQPNCSCCWSQARGSFHPCMPQWTKPHSVLPSLSPQRVADWSSHLQTDWKWSRLELFKIDLSQFKAKCSHKSFRIPFFLFKDSEPLSVVDSSNVSQKYSREATHSSLKHQIWVRGEKKSKTRKINKENQRNLQEVSSHFSQVDLLCCAKVVLEDCRPQL